MAAEIPLFQRSEVGPTRAGAAKPGFDLIDTSTSEIGAAVADFSGPLFNRLVKAKAANEVAAFQGARATELQKLDTFIAGNPGASFEEFDAERKKTFKNIDALGGQATTRIAKENIKRAGGYIKSL